VEFISLKIFFRYGNQEHRKILLGSTKKTVLHKKKIELTDSISLSAIFATNVKIEDEKILQPSKKLQVARV
jgi:hypothetical protein